MTYHTIQSLKQLEELEGLRKDLREQSIAEKTGEMIQMEESEKYFKPIIDSQKEMMHKMAPEVVEGSLAEVERKGGEMAGYYLSRLATSAGDKSYGIKFGEKGLKMGKSNVLTSGNDLKIEGKVYKGTEGLWQLLTLANPNNIYATQEDKGNYEEIMFDTKVIYRDDGKGPRSSGNSKKWQMIVSPMWKKRKNPKQNLEEKEFAILEQEESQSPTLRSAAEDNITKRKKVARGLGLKTTKYKTISLPCDKNALLKKLELLLASKRSGGTGLQNEIVSICDELKRLGHISNDEFRQLQTIK